MYSWACRQSATIAARTANHLYPLHALITRFKDWEVKWQMCWTALVWGICTWLYAMFLWKGSLLLAGQLAGSVSPQTRWVPLSSVGRCRTGPTQGAQGGRDGENKTYQQPGACRQGRTATKQGGTRRKTQGSSEGNHFPRYLGRSAMTLSSSKMSANCWNPSKPETECLFMWEGKRGGV